MSIEKMIDEWSDDEWLESMRATVDRIKAAIISIEAKRDKDKEEGT